MMQSIRTFRTPATAFGMRQRVAAGREEALTGNLLRPLSLILLSALTVTFLFSQFLHGRIDNNGQVLAQLQSARRDVGSENISLLAARARLMSESHVEAVAGAHLQLYRPEKGQLHRL